MILSLDSILNVRLVTIWQLFVGKRKGREVTRLFFSFFYPREKFTDRTRSLVGTASWLTVQHFDHYTKLSGGRRRFRRCIYTRAPNSSISPARWQRDWPLSLDNTFETDKGTTRGRTQIFQWKLSGLLVLGLEWFSVTSNSAKKFFELLKIDFENWQNLGKFCTVARIVVQTYLYCWNLQEIQRRAQNFHYLTLYFIFYYFFIWYTMVLKKSNENTYTSE